VSTEGQPRIIVLVGLPGSGKSTYLKERGLPALSSDTLRQLLADDETEQSIHAQVFSALRYLLRERLRLRRPVTYIDATHITPAERRPYIEIGRKHDCRVEALFFDIPPEVCKQRNRGRSRVVPDSVIDRMAQKLELPTVAEGFAAVEVVRDGAGGSTEA
jgi:predicted kinase